MTTNVSFALLDAAVIAGTGRGTRGRPDDACTAARGGGGARGVLHHLGVGKAVPVVIDLESGLDAVVAARQLRASGES